MQDRLFGGRRCDGEAMAMAMAQHDGDAMARWRVSDAPQSAECDLLTGRS
jgi:hypothetical protein